MTTKLKRLPQFQCMECGKLYYSAAAAERAAFGSRGCTGCGGSDIDVYVPNNFNKYKRYKKLSAHRLALPSINEHILRLIGEKNHLTPINMNRFIQFGLIWWEGKVKDINYVSEWAGRFAKGTEYAMADEERLNILLEVDGVADARNRLFSSYIQYGWSPDKAEREVMRIYPIGMHKISRRKKKVVRKK